jgi:hypothetical protein
MQHNPAKAKQTDTLAAALKRNMARRKAVASRQSFVVSEEAAPTMEASSVASHGEPRSGSGEEINQIVRPVGRASHE